MAVPYKLSYLEIETGLSPASTFKHTGDFLANRIIKYLGTSDDILLGDGTTTSLAGKQNTITLTTTGSSGAATLTGATLNIPDYGSALTAYVPYSGATSDVDLGNYALNAQYVIGIVEAGSSQSGVQGVANNGSGVRGVANNGSGIKGESTTGIGGNFVSGCSSTIGTLEVMNTSTGFLANFFSAGSVLRASISNEGNITANSLIKAGGLSTQFLKADGSVDSIAYGTGSVTSVAALTLGTTGTDLSSTVANSTTTPVITLNVPTASAANRGVVSATDWTTFNSKQDALNGTGFVKISGTTISYDNSTYLTTIEGIVASGELSGTYASPTLVNSAVIGKVLTGLNITGGTVASTDSILQAFGKVQNQINGLIGGSIFQGVWDASTNTPALASGVGTNGHYYIVSVDGSTNLDGITDWKIGDWAIFAGTTWEKVDNTDAVASVNGYTGTVSLVTGDVLEGAGTLPSRPSQLYFTDARARAAISLTTTGSSGVSTYDNITGVLNVPNYGSALTAYVPYTGATSNVNLGAFNITASSLIKAGGTVSQFLKADGSVDNNNYLTANDLPSTLSLYATNVAAAVAGYFKLVTTIDDPDYNTIPVDIPTGAITTTNQLIASLVSPVNLINGNPGVFNVTTTGNITRISGSGEAEFFFRIYKRDSGGVETLVGTSSNTIPVINSGYSEFFATAIWNDGIFDVTDSIVLKYYANRISGGSNPTYQFQFGGDQPVRTIVPIPTAVIPNIFLEELADVEDGVASNNDGIFFDSSVSLWKYKSVSEVLGYTPANDASVVHLDGTETITGRKTFNNVNGLTIDEVSGALVPTKIFSSNIQTLNYAVSNTSNNFLGTFLGTVTANRTYSIPDISGTLALTSQLSAYVPYTGATGAVNLGAYDLTVNGINIGLGGGAISTNTRVGKNALIANTIGSFNTSIGRISLNENTTGGSNTAIGDFALGSNTTGGLNIAQGAGAGNSNTTGSNNIFLGYNSTGESATESNRTWIGNTSTTSTWLGGNLLLGSRTNATSDKLQITGGAKITGIITLGTGADSYVYDSGGSLILQTGASPRLTINPAGNLGLGVTPSAWGSSKALQIGATSVLWNYNNTENFYIGSNYYFDGSRKYIVNGYASEYAQFSGSHVWYNAPSGTAGNAISFTQAMTLTAGGNLGVGTASPNHILTANTNVSGGTYLGLYQSYVDGNDWRNWAIGTNNQAFGDFVITQSNATGGNPISADGTIRFYISKVGNVLIGTTTDSGYKLDVNGTGRFSGQLHMPTNVDIAYGALSGNYIGQYYNGTDLHFYNGTGGSNLFSINRSTGAATFSSSVSVGPALTGRLSVRGTTDDSSAYAFEAGNSSGATLFVVRNDAAVFAQGIYNFTTGSGANVVVFSDGSMQRSTSSLKYKKNVENYTKGLKEVMQMRPVTYNSKNENETQTFAGLIAEEIHDLGLAEFVQYATDGSPDALSYSNMVSLLVKAIQELNEKITQLENK